MKVHKRILRTVSGLTATTLAFSWSLQAQPAQATELRTFQVATGDTLIVENDYGRVRVSTWEKPHLAAEIRTIGPSPASLDSVTVVSQKAGDKIFFQSYFYNYSSQSVYLDIQTPASIHLVVWGANPAVELHGLRGYTRVNTLTGLITAGDLLASASLATETGNILYRLSEPPSGDVRLESLTGSIECRLREDLNLRGWLRAGGTLSWNHEIEMERGSLEKQLGIGGPLLYANSQEGSVTFLLDNTLQPATVAASTISNPDPRIDAGSAVYGANPGVDDRKGSVSSPGDSTNAGATSAGGRNRGAPPTLSTGGPVSERDPDDPNLDRPRQVPERANTSGGASFSVNVDWVYLHASVRDRYTNRAIPHLRRQDFALYEEGIEQQIEKFESGEAPFNLLLLLDVSGSTRSYVDLIREASVEFTRELKPNDLLALATFQSRTRLLQDFTNDRRDIVRAIRGVRSNGGTAFYDALETSVVDYLDGIEGRKAIVVFTDGVDNQLTGDYGSGSTTTFEQVYRLVQEEDVLIYTIFLDTEAEHGRSRRGRGVNLGDILGDILRGGGIGGGDPAYAAARRQLEMLADQTGGRMYAPRDVRDLGHVYSEIANDLRIQYTLAYSSSNPRRDGRWREIRLEVVSRDNVAVRTRRGYYAGRP